MFNYANAVVYHREQNKCKCEYRACFGELYFVQLKQMSETQMDKTNRFVINSVATQLEEYTDQLWDIQIGRLIKSVVIESCDWMKSDTT